MVLADHIFRLKALGRFLLGIHRIDFSIHIGGDHFATCDMPPDFGDSALLMFGI